MSHMQKSHPKWWTPEIYSWRTQKKKKKKKKKNTKYQVVESVSHIYKQCLKTISSQRTKHKPTLQFVCLWLFSLLNHHNDAISKNHHNDALSL